MNHNKLNLQPGDTVRLDKEFRNSSIVVIKSITPLGMYSTIHSAKIKNPTNKDCWETMTNRLSKIEKQ